MARTTQRCWMPCGNARLRTGVSRCWMSRSSDERLEELAAAGIRGLRFNLVDVASTTTLPVETIRQLARRIESLGWHIELLIHVDDYPNLDQILGEIPVDVVVGHLGYFRPHRRTDDEGFQTLVRLMQSGRVWTKLTGPYRVSADALPYSNVSAFCPGVGAGGTGTCNLGLGLAARYGQGQHA